MRSIPPKRLQPGDCIGIVAPAGPVAEEELRSGLAVLRKEGFETCLAAHLYSRRGYLAGDDKCRLEDLHRMFQDPDVSAVFCARGGYGSMRLLDHLEYDALQRHPKVFMGYSDITALILAIHARTGMITFHGPVLRELGPGNGANFRHLKKLLCSEQPVKLKLRSRVPVRPGRVQGRLLGGNLALVCHMLGTPFLPRLDGAILFIEDNEPLYRIDRMLTQLLLSGQLVRVKAVVAGKFKGCAHGNALRALLAERLGGLEIPVAAGLETGHGPRNLALPLGSTAELDTEAMTLSILEPAVAG